MNQQSTPRTILCFGDANTHGYNSSSDRRFSETERWTCLLEKYLGSEYRIISEGLAGRTTVFDDPILEGVNGFPYLFPCLMSHEPIDLLIIMLGTNDVKERFSTTPENVAKGLERLARKAIDTKSAWRSKPRILLIAPPPIEDGYENTLASGEMGRGCAAKSRALAPLYKNVSRRIGCQFLDAGSVAGIEMYPYDHMHLSMMGHELLARKLSDLIPKLF